MLALSLFAVGALGACESTQDRSRRLAAEGKGLAAEEGVVVTRQAKGVKVVETGVVRDANGVAAIVTVRNTTTRTLWQVPVSIDVRSRGRSVFRNDRPGLEPSLVRIPLLRPGQTFSWVNDQVAATNARAVRATVGEGSTIGSARIPRVALTATRLQPDPVSGIAAVGIARNRSTVEQRKLVVFAVARKGGRVVAAGRAQIPRLKARKHARFQAFFIGNPRGARLDVSAPPSTLR